MLNIVIFGAGGRAGAAAALEASARGHYVSPLGRADADVTNPQAVARAALGSDAAVVAVAPADGDPVEFYRAAADSLVEGLLEARVNRLVWVSIASLLADADGVTPVDAESFPEAYRPFSIGHRAALQRFTRSGLAWTAVSPAGDFDRRGVLRSDYTLTEVGDPAAQISYADHAHALIDVVELPGAHLGKHVGVLWSPSDAATPSNANAVAAGLQRSARVGAPDYPGGCG